MDTNPWNDFASVLQRAHDAQQRGDKELAYEFFARASELNPNAAEGWQGRAETSTVPDDTLLSLAYAAALEPANPTHKQELTQQLETRAIAAQASDAPALVVIGQKLAEVGLTQEAQQILRRATELDATQETGLIWLAGLVDDPGESVRLLHLVLARNPKNTLAQAGLDAVTHQMELAAGVAPEPTATPAAPTLDLAAGMIREGEQALAQGDMARANQLFVRATEISPRNENAWLGRARATSDIDEALTCLEQALAINPNNAQAREARTFYRVRKLREGMRKTPETATPSRFAPVAVPSREPEPEPPPVRRAGWIVPLVILILILLVLLLGGYYFFLR